MRRFLTKSLEIICQIAMFLIIIAATAGGAESGGVPGAVVGFLAGFVFSAVTFGGVFLLMDIADNTRRTVELLEKSSA